MKIEYFTHVTLQFWNFIQNMIVILLKLLDFHFCIKNRNLCVLVFYYGVFWGQHENWVFYSCYTSVLKFYSKMIVIFLKLLDFHFCIKTRILCVLVFYYGVLWRQHENWVFFSCYTSILKFYSNMIVIFF